MPERRKPLFPRRDENQDYQVVKKQIDALVTNILAESDKEKHTENVEALLELSRKSRGASKKDTLH